MWRHRRKVWWRPGWGVQQRCTALINVMMSAIVESAIGFAFSIAFAKATNGADCMALWQAQDKVFDGAVGHRSQAQAAACANRGPRHS